MEFTFGQTQEKQKITELEKALNTLQTKITSEHIALGARLFNLVKENSPEVHIEQSVFNSWLALVTERKEHTDTILHIKTALERKDQLKALSSESKKLLSQKSAEVKKLKEDFTLLVYQNHKEDFLEAIQQVPDIAKLEAEIETEKTKITGLSDKTEKATFFNKFIPTIQTFLSKGKVSTSEFKLKKLIQESAQAIFSDQDFVSLMEMSQELPNDIQEILANLKTTQETQTSISEKLKDIEAEENQNNSILESYNALSDSKKRLSELAGLIKNLDARVEALELHEGETCVHAFFDSEGLSLTDGVTHTFHQHISAIGELLREVQHTKTQIAILSKTIDLKNLEEKRKNTRSKIEKWQKQIHDLQAHIAEAEKNEQDYTKSIATMQEHIDTLGLKLPPQ